MPALCSGSTSIAGAFDRSDPVAIRPWVATTTGVEPGPPSRRSLPWSGQESFPVRPNTSLARCPTRFPTKGGGSPSSVLMQPLRPVRHRHRVRHRGSHTGGTRGSRAWPSVQPSAPGPPSPSSFPGSQIDPIAPSPRSWPVPDPSLHTPSSPAPARTRSAPYPGSSSSLWGAEQHVVEPSADGASDVWGESSCPWPLRVRGPSRSGPDLTLHSGRCTGCVATAEAGLRIQVVAGPDERGPNSRAQMIVVVPGPAMNLSKSETPAEAVTRSSPGRGRC
jgi:hypothetical protein